MSYGHRRAAAAAVACEVVPTYSTSVSSFACKPSRADGPASAQHVQNDGYGTAGSSKYFTQHQACCVLKRVGFCTPQETLEYFSKPENLNSDVLPPGLEAWDPAPYLASAAPIFVAVLGINFSHELGHRIAAFVRWAEA